MSKLGEAIIGALGDDDETARAWAAEADALTSVAACALELATAAPWRRAHHTPSALVPWPLIERARRELEGAGVDWRAFKTRTERKAD